jgi:hypothetical protein
VQSYYKGKFKNIDKINKKERASAEEEALKKQEEELNKIIMTHP